MNQHEENQLFNYERDRLGFGVAITQKIMRSAQTHPLNGSCRVKGLLRNAYKRAKETQRVLDSNVMEDGSSAEALAEWILECVLWLSLNQPGYDFRSQSCDCYTKEMKNALKERLALAQSTLVDPQNDLVDP